MANKYYAVKEGKAPGIYTSWEECKKQVHGYSGAIYKSFKTKEEAEQFVSGETERQPVETVICQSKTNPLQNKDCLSPDTISLKEHIVTSNKEAVAYVDGSYNVATKEFSYGVVMFFQGEELHFSEKVEGEDLASMRNVAGEIKGAEAAMRFAVEHNCPKLTIYHDYEGIARWCRGEWKANKEGTKAYKAYYDSIRHLLSVEFVKVKGHSNDKYNDLADALAKKAIF